MHVFADGGADGGGIGGEAISAEDHVILGRVVDLLAEDVMDKCGTLLVRVLNLEARRLIGQLVTDCNDVASVRFGCEQTHLEGFREYEVGTTTDDDRLAARAGGS